MVEKHHHHDRRSSDGRPGNIHDSSSGNCLIEIESILRIRPLLKKEHGDTVLLEPQPPSQQSQPHDVATVTLNPHFASLTSPSTSTTHAGGVGASSSIRGRIDSDGTTYTVPTDYHFNHVLPETTSQEKIFFTLGLPIVKASMASLKSAATTSSSSSRPSNKSRAAKTSGAANLIVCMGVVNSGKTYTCWGGGSSSSSSISKRRSSHDGIIPRLLDGLFKQSEHVRGHDERNFAVQITMTHVTQQSKKGTSNHNNHHHHPKDGGSSTVGQIYDLLASSSSSSSSRDNNDNTNNGSGGNNSTPGRNFNVRSIAKRFEAVRSPVRSTAPAVVATKLDSSNPTPKIETCTSISRAREVVQSGLVTSQKLAADGSDNNNNNNNVHLYITLQPVLDGNKFGDKIAILDMAGVDKEKRSQSRGKDSVASVNQAASSAVLHCLRTLKHNDSVLRGNKTNEDGMMYGRSHYGDDDMSELSCVSRPKKNPTQQKKMELKTVPYRQHSVTMLLKKLFSSSSITSAKVSIILAAYPGHVDVGPKRTLLQDLELLHGSSLATRIITPAFTGLVPQSIIHEHEYDRQDDFEEESQRGGHRPKSPTERTDPRDRVCRVEVQTSNRPTEAVPYPDVLVAKKLSPMTEGIQNHNSPSDRASSRVSMSEQMTKKRETFASDFPGVNFLLTSPTVDAWNENENKNENEENEKAQTRDEIIKRGVVIDQQEPFTSYHQNASHRQPRQALVIKASDRSHVRKTKHSISPRFARVMQVQHEANVNSHPSQQERHKRELQKDATNKLDERNDREIVHIKQVKALEAKLQKALQENKALKHLCSTLEEENADLKNTLRETGRKALQTRWTQLDEKEFQDSRRLRREHQNIIKAPMQQHLDKVNQTYEIKNQWCMTNKPHFSLQLPNQFQRAHDLNVRDKENKKKEEEEGDGTTDGDANHNLGGGSGEIMHSHSMVDDSKSTAEESMLFAPRSSVAGLKKLAPTNTRI